MESSSQQRARGKGSPWDAVKGRLAETSRRDEAQAGGGSAAERRAALDARARALAVPLEKDERAEAGTEHLVFTLGAGRYALPLAAVREIARLAEGLTPLPGAPPGLAGLALMRGATIPAAELASLLGLPPAPASRAHLIVLETSADDALALLADAADAIAVLLPSRILRRAADSELVRGVTADGLVVLDAQALLAAKTLRAP